jgi:hypothetical protein
VKKSNKLSRISFLVNSPPSQDGSPFDASASPKSPSFWGLWGWTFVCLACSFAASLFIASICYSLWISSLKPTLELICIPVNQGLLRNTQSSSALKKVTVPSSKDLI